MSNGNDFNFYNDVRMKIMNLRIKQNNDLDDFSKWINESEQQMLARSKAMPIISSSPPADDKVIEVAIAVPSPSGKPDRE
jgi:hypothetical protein